MPVVDPEHREVVAKRDVLGEVVYVLHQEATERRMRLEQIYSRAVLRSEIHEIITTAEAGGPGQTVDVVSYVAFFEVSQGGVLRVGDVVRIGDHMIGELAGFDLTHYPNHLNLVVRAASARSGKDLEVRLAANVRFSLT
jgi:hypothetical protein